MTAAQPADEDFEALYRRLDEVALLHREHFSTDDTSIDDPAGGRQTQDDVAQAQSHDGVDGQGEQDEWERELDVGDTHEDGGRPPLNEAGGEAQKAPDHGRDQHRATSDEERQPSAIENARENISAELVSAEEMAG